MPRCADLQLTVSKPGAVVPAAGWPAGVPRARVALVTRSLDFYFPLGCEVRSAADWLGAALLRTEFVGPDPGHTPRKLTRRPADRGVAAGPAGHAGRSSSAAASAR